MCAVEGGTRRGMSLERGFEASEATGFPLSSLYLVLVVDDVSSKRPFTPPSWTLTL